MRKGFTLVELSIVLVIIGLLIGGIVIGQSLIESARINAQIQQFQQIQIAVNNFKTTYKALPGDTNKFATAGNRNGVIEAYSYYGSLAAEQYATWWANAYSSESPKAFNHLATAKMLKYNTFNDTATASNLAGIGYPEMKLQTTAPTANGFKGGVAIGWEPEASYIKQGHKLRLGACPGLSTGPNTAAQQISFYCSILPAQAAGLDAKLDDGKPYSGDAVITASYYVLRVPNNPFGGGEQTSSCGDPSTNTYKTTSTTGDCALELYMGF